jgi:hypothetical protein
MSTEVTEIRRGDRWVNSQALVQYQSKVLVVGAGPVWVRYFYCSNIDGGPYGREKKIERAVFERWFPTLVSREGDS